MVVIEQRTRLSGGEVAAVRRLVEAASDDDGVAPLSEHVLLHLRHGGDETVQHLLALDAEELVGYAHLDATDVVQGSSAELVVAPRHRRQGVGSSLVERLAELAPDDRLRLWAHGSQPAARALAERHGFRRTRALWQMRRSLYSSLPSVGLPEGVQVRAFRTGEDEQAWIEVNNRAFADHPEQGHWTLEDLLVREREPWFDPEGFFLAERDGTIVGFHWTKVHGHDHQHEPMGEVYVVGVDPGAQGGGLGRALTVLGLRHLRARGLGQAMLYVDEANAAAIRVYESLGFQRWDTDVTYRRD